MTKKKGAKTVVEHQEPVAAPIVKLRPEPEAEPEREPAPAPEVEVTALVPTPLAGEVQPYLQRAFGPMSRLTRAWLAESEKLQQIEVDRMHSIIDDTHRLALEGLATFTSLGITMQRGFFEQLEQIERILPTD